MTVQVRRGLTRTVILTQRYAFKLPLGRSWRMTLYGLLSNMQEGVWGRSGRAFLCPVLWSIRGGWLVVMRRAAPYPTGWPLPEMPPECFWVDLKHENLGLLDGQAVVVDYGELT